MYGDTYICRNERKEGWLDDGCGYTNFLLAPYLSLPFTSTFNSCFLLDGMVCRGAYWHRASVREARYVLLAGCKVQAEYSGSMRERRAGDG